MSGSTQAARTKSLHPAKQFDWNDDRVEELKKLVAERLSYSEIARIMGDGLTRNAVLGKALRMKLRGTEDRSRAHGKRGQSAKNPARTVAARRARTENLGGLGFKIAKAKREGLSGAEAIEAAVSHQVDQRGQALLHSSVWQPLAGVEPISLLRVNEHTCKWAVGDAPIVFCGLHSESGSPYCAHHRQIATGGADNG